MRGRVTDVYQRADDLLATLPVLGCAQAPRTIWLAHFSANTAITSFHLDSSKCVCVDTLAIDIKRIGATTGDMEPASYRALYLIKVGVIAWPDSSDLIPTVKKRPGAWECTLGFSVAAGSFGKILVTHDATTDELIVV